MGKCDIDILKEVRRVSESVSGVSEQVGRLDERVGALESKFAVFLRDHNDLVELKTKWKFAVGLAAFFGMAFTTLLISFIKG